MVEKKILRMRQGNEADFNAGNLLPGEFAVSLDKQKVRIGFGAGKTKELASIDDVNDKIAEFKNTVDGEIAEAVAEVEEAGQRVLATIPTDYTETAQNADTAIRTKASAIACTAEGESIAVSDSSGDYMRGLRIFGRTEQASTTGKNKLNLELLKIVSNVTLVNGVVTQIKADTSPAPEFKIQGYRNGAFVKVLVFTDLGGVGLKKYSFANTNEYDRFTIGVNGTVIDTTVSYSTENLPEGDYILTCEFTNVTQGAISWKDMMIRPANITDATFEPYTGGAPSPSMNYPQELVNVGASGEIGADVLGKNLIKLTATNQTLNGVKFTVNEDGSITVNGTAIDDTHYQIGYVSYRIGKTYRINGCPKGGNQSTGYSIYSAISGTYVYDIGGGTRLKATVDTAASSVRILVCKGATVSNLTFYPMVRFADIADDSYEPPYIQTLTHSIPGGLAGIKVTDASLATYATYTNADGQAYIADYIDETVKEYMQMVVKVVFDGSDDENWYVLDSGRYAYLNIGTFGSVMNGMIMCDKFTRALINSNNTNEGIDIANSVTGVARILLRPSCNELPFANQAEVKAWLQANPITVQYALAEPIRHPLTAAEIAAFKQLKTNYPHTTLLNDAGAWMEVEYNADTKTWILNQIAQLQSAIINSLA